MASDEEADLIENGDRDVENRERSEEDNATIAGAQTQPESNPPSSDAASEEIVWFLFGSGVLLTLILLIRRPKRFVDWLLPLGLIGAGIFFLYRQGNTLWQKREARKESALQVIQDELDALDPIARVEVLKAVGEKQLGIEEAGSLR